MANNSVSEEVVLRLANRLKALVPELAQVLTDWPDSNQALKYPALSIFTKAPTLVQHSASQISADQVEEADLKGMVRYNVGEYEWKLQLDLWTGYKADRHRLFDRIFKAFNSALPISGLSLELPDYFGAHCRYDLLGYEFPDTEEQAQRKEWRCRMEVIATTAAIVERQEQLIKVAEVQFDTHEGDQETVEINLDP